MPWKNIIYQKNSVYCFMSISFYHYFILPAAPVKQTRRKYERNFLLRLQYMPLCTTKPAGLPDIEVVLDAPVQQRRQSTKVIDCTVHCTLAPMAGISSCFVHNRVKDRFVIGLKVKEEHIRAQNVGI